MIKVRMSGGLGNQMFQYAAGRSLAEKNKTSVVLDITRIINRLPRKNFAFRDFELGDLKANFRLDFFSRMASIKGLADVAFIAAWFFHRLGRKVFLEKTPKVFDNEFLSLPDGVCLDGFWQNEEYFSGIKKIIKEEFLLKDIIDQNSLEWLEKIKKSPSVAIHVRRGDYVNLGLDSVCGQEYYDNSIKVLGEQVVNPEFFIFTDDHTWCKERFSGENFHIVSDGKRKAAVDMYLMSQCQHQIIANSSFSWWAAWLNDNYDKILISPKY